MNAQEALDIIENNATETLYFYGSWSKCPNIVNVYRNGIHDIGIACEVPIIEIEERLNRIFDNPKKIIQIPDEIKKEKIIELLCFLINSKNNLSDVHGRNIEFLIEYLQDYYKIDTFEPLLRQVKYVQAGWNLKEMVVPTPKMKKQSTKIKIEYEGKYYYKKELAKKFNQKTDTVYYRLKQGWSLEDALKSPLHTQNRGTGIEYKGKTYRSIRELAKKQGINPKTVNYRLSLGWSLEDAVEKAVRSRTNIEVVPTPKAEKRKIEYKGKYYYIKELAKKYNQKTPTVYYRLKQGWSLEDALKSPPHTQNKGKGIEYKGKTYRSIRELAEKQGINPCIVNYRLSLGWSLEDAVEKAVRHRESNIENEPNRDLQM